MLTCLNPYSICKEIGLNIDLYVDYCHMRASAHRFEANSVLIDLDAGKTSSAFNAALLRGVRDTSPDTINIGFAWNRELCGR